MLTRTEAVPLLAEQLREAVAWWDAYGHYCPVLEPAWVELARKLLERLPKEGAPC